MTATARLAPLLVALAVLSVPVATGWPGSPVAASHGPPTANAGPDQAVFVGTNVTLDGSRSISLEHSQSFDWFLLENPGHDELENPNSVHPTFTPSTSGTYVAGLTVTDEEGRQDTDTVTIEVTATAVARPTLDASLATGSVIPGEETNLSVSLANNGSVAQGSPDDPSITERIGTVRGLNVSVGREEGGPLRVRTGNFGIGSLAEGEATSLSVPVSVDPDARPGRYRVPVNVSFAYTEWIAPDGNESNVRGERTPSLDLTVEPAPQFRVANVSTGLRVNDTDTVAVTLENVGSGEATGSTVGLSSANPDVDFGGDAATRFVGRWGPGETRTVAVEATASDGAAPQPYPIEVEVAWDDDGQRRTDARTVPLQPRPEASFDVAAGSSTLAVDATGRLRGTVTNTGTEPVENAVVVLADRPGTFRPRETEQFLGALAPGETATFAFPVEVGTDASAGPHQVGVVVRYRTGGDERRESRVMDLPAPVAPERSAFDVAADGPAIEAGAGSTVSVSVTNAGDGAYRDLTVRAFPGGALGGTGEASIDRLAPGESTDVDLALSALGATAGKTYPVAIDVRYVDADDETKIAGTYRVPVRVVEPDDDGGGLPVVPLAVVGIVLAVGVWYWRRR